MASKEAIVALEKHIKDFKPDHRICLGDMFDFRALRKGIGREESDAYSDLVTDTTAAYGWLERLKPTVFLNGNHEYRLYHYQQGVHTIGKVAFIHGYSASQAAVKQSAEVYSPSGGATVMGHLHRIEAVHAVRHGGAQGYSGGCLASIPALTYASLRHATMRWANGWLYGLISTRKGGGFKIWQAEKVDGVWIHP